MEASDKKFSEQTTPDAITPDAPGSEPSSVSEPTSTPPCPRGPDDCPIFNRIEQLEQELHQLREEAQTDGLTHLYNTRYFHRALTRELERTDRTGQPTTLVLLDLDHFKKINDNYGHPAGDKVLQTVASILQTSLRKLDTSCRYGGEEFAMILPSTPALVAVQVAERVRRKIASTPVKWNGTEIHISASFGLDTYSVGSKLSEQVFLEQVDKCLYESKNNGRNRITCGKKEKTAAEISSAEKSALQGLFDDPKPVNEPSKTDNSRKKKCE